MYVFIMNENIWHEKWSNEQIRALFLEQSKAFQQRDLGVERTQLASVEKAANAPHAVIISGLRRVGKSTLLAQLAHRIGHDSYYYVNFEDDRFLGFQAEDANYLFSALVEHFGERRVFIIDEIQNIPGWERFVRRFMDMGFKFYITGSNASLLSREMGTRLTGRYVPIELFPFSFREYLRFRDINPPDQQRLTTAESAAMRSELAQYLLSGGIPDALKYPELPLLRTLYDDVLYRDIAARHRLEAVSALKELAFYLMSNPAGLVSFNKLKERFRLGSVNTIKNYIDYMADSWLIFTLNLYDHSVKRQQIAPKKIYSIDTGLSKAIGFEFSANSGKHLENLVFLALRRQTQSIYYYATPGGYEVDFYLPESSQLIQVVQHLRNPDIRTREIRAIEDAVQHLPVKRALILSDQNEDAVEVGNVAVQICATASWLLSQ